MKRARRAAGIVVLVGILLLIAIWASRIHLARQVSLREALHSQITNAVGFAKAHFTGGVGAILKMDPTNGVPIIMQVRAGSPAEKAGLRKDDLIIEVNGAATKGQTLSQTIEKMRGFAAGSITLVIQRPGSTNLQFVIHRSSWKSLGVPTSDVP